MFFPERSGANAQDLEHAQNATFLSWGSEGHSLNILMEKTSLLLEKCIINNSEGLIVLMFIDSLGMFFKIHRWLVHGIC